MNRDRVHLNGAKVLEHVSHPFIVSLHYAFQTPKKWGFPGRGILRNEFFDMI